jgi:DNA-binding transcriptional regulator GbsR (MarR family)
MQGRVVAFFVIVDPPEKTFEEIVRYFNASKSSVSNSLNSLLSSGIIDYRTFAEKRKRYFFVTDGFMQIYFRDVLRNVGEMREMIYKIVSMRSPDFPQATEKILRWIENSNTFEASIATALDDTGAAEFV